METHSLWLIPPEPVYSKFRDLIGELAKTHHTPFFVPHVTILGGITETEKDALLKTQQLAAELHPFLIRLKDFGYEEHIHRALFICVEKTRELINANNKARQLFRHLPNPNYTPHLNLLYGYFPTSVKENLIATLGSQFSDVFQIKSISLFRKVGEHSWVRVKEFDLV